MTSAASRYPLALLISLGVVACVAADLTHEVLGHVTASLLVGDPILSVSTVAVQSAAPNRWVAAAGTMANVIAGLLALFLLKTAAGSLAKPLFLWVFAAFNLLNGGYLIASAVLNNGDWAAVIGGLSPPILWRTVIGVMGVLIYAGSLRELNRHMADLVRAGVINSSELSRLVWSAYLAGGAVLTLAATLNPISPTLILLSGVGASFGLNWGMLLVPQSVAEIAPAETSPAQTPSTTFWVILAVLVSAAFIGVLGPGIGFS